MIRGKYTGLPLDCLFDLADITAFFAREQG